MIILILLGMLIIVKIIFPVISLFCGSQTMCGLYYISPVRDEGRRSSRCFPHTECSQQTLSHTVLYLQHTNAMYVSTCTLGASDFLAFHDNNLCALIYLKRKGSFFLYMCVFRNMCSCV